MADLSVNICGIESPNPFWLASAPPTNTGAQIVRAFDAGWGGAVWKTLGDPIENVYSRYSSVDMNGQRMMGFSNIELITDRSLEINLIEIAEVKRRYPENVVVVSLMVDSNPDAWDTIIKQVEQAGADAIELNFGCPHGMSERGMGSAVGQVPEYTCDITGWAKESATVPVFVKLTPNITDIRVAARAAKTGGADAVSLINTINSITGVDLDSFTPRPVVGRMSSHGGYSGPAVKPIGLNMVASIAADPFTEGLPISGIGGIATWQDVAEYILLGATTIQVCTAVMHYGYRIVEGMAEGLSNYLDSKGMASVNELRGLSVNKVVDWQDLDVNYIVKAEIDQDKCIHCGLCYIACYDGAHQAIGVEYKDDETKVWIIDDLCVGCNLCSLVCPVQGCIEMVERDHGQTHMSWNDYLSDEKPGELYPRPKHGLTIGPT
ncbi:MAG: NAD-dependent dihydropyrimidine dehydrogenase subunit PreA [Actinomycetota bacterium]|nr:NAD-dependent dihydropyrimidine dehydrogenase subunit PreA [Actinomycetota bacterium]MDK1027265.1 NAD-dependent dihydropyrimidine dehydrogenase subunit PreA [Actinomycetota bacterium]MDK1097569.1 NAD-dependent dihydropyrimidine dehydrogenase subunit PreA [Actinomycetota bacterium]MDK1103761.1 NAD-dependent dihydropyrimidine dehydrogenase subunit PreA [Actinomycetota bacterium]MDK1291487.1 NAD-dependent dihydropyrimidine dehydrogenase subunit PreA [Actinomycetota bacterium]